MNLKASFLTSAAVLGLAGAAHASDPFEPIGYFDALVFNNLNGNSGDVEGRLAVGGNMTTTSGYSVGDRAPDDNTKNSLVVGGTLNASLNWQVFNGNAKYANGTNLPSMESGYTIQQQSNVVNFSDIYVGANWWSNYLAGFSDNGTQLYQWTTYTLTGTDANLNVFNVNAADWAAASDRQIHAPSGSTVLINISGASASMQNGMHADSWLHDFGLKNTNIILNFSEATSLNLSNIEVLGSVLAPNANLTISGGSIDGKVVVGSATQLNGGEFHRWGFTGSAPVPEPASMAALGMGVVALIRRRKAKKA
ncbi:MAG: hypothetical protein BGO01_19400 [Armatimonadetes bacterium 55-13]|nr:choice-of-anchor A family protein [Armatimonadota bacterium]OJU64283.1 MAG: hypothetical protein BGO01_19400 [Armatimonadetes bacterium 55-13]